jgi:hypothetical protein
VNTTQFLVFMEVTRMMGNNLVNTHMVV